jgi:aerobic-type carbon monoxide dehydrogenase small subunit (CoxS/CutS family)
VGRKVTPPEGAGVDPPRSLAIFESVLGRPQKILISLDLNGQRYELAVEPRSTLLEAIRYTAGLTGSKQGCDKGDCGACPVLSNGAPILSCISLAVEHQGDRITTIEGLAQGCKVHPVQDAFDLCGALQCGFCQSGMMISAAALLERNPKPTREQIKEALSGNLCRCTGYTKILEAVEVASGQRRLEELDPRPTTGSVA